LKGSKIILDENPEILIDIIMNGYDAREEFAEMPAVGSNASLTPAEVTAIINHERTSWGNDAGQITEEKVKEILQFIKSQTLK
jgi:cytochrome c oxidase cbb3-type subunit 2